jgi:hypothetical protein
MRVRVGPSLKGRVSPRTESTGRLPPFATAFPAAMPFYKDWQQTWQLAVRALDGRGRDEGQAAEKSARHPGHFERLRKRHSRSPQDWFSTASIRW